MTLLSRASCTVPICFLLSAASIAVLFALYTFVIIMSPRVRPWFWWPDLETLLLSTVQNSCYNVVNTDTSRWHSEQRQLAELTRTQQTWIFPILITWECKTEMCIFLWQGPPHINKVKQHEVVLFFKVRLFIQFIQSWRTKRVRWGIKTNQVGEDLINIST